MTFAVLSLRIRKGILIFILVALMGGYSIHESAGYSGGVVGASKSGCACHGSKSSETVIKVYTDSAQMLEGKTYVFTLSVANPSEKGAGCDMSADGGGVLALSGSSSGLQFYDGELTHTSPRTFAGDSAVWTFKYTAPMKAGVAHIYVAGNAVNLDGIADAADHWNTVVHTINVVSAGVEPSDNVASSISIFPNPSQGRFTITTLSAIGPAKIEVSDQSGQIVYDESMILGTTTPLDLSALPNGAYFLSIQTKGGQSFTRCIAIGN